MRLILTYPPTDDSCPGGTRHRVVAVRAGRGAPRIALLLLLALPRPAAAGQRNTVWAYPPGAGPKGSLEVETWYTGTKETSASPTGSEYRVEVENGLTDDVSLDVYLAVLTQTEAEGFRFDRVQASVRANLLPDRMRGLLDLTGYFEVKRDVEWSNPWEFEAILIAGKAYGPFSWSVNLVVESELSSKAFETATTEWKGIATAGYELSRSVWGGAELLLANDQGRHEVSLGPTLSFRLTPKSWIAIGPQFGLNGDADRLQVRAIFGMFF